MHSHSPTFGMDVFSSDFKEDGFVILQNNGKGNKGIPIKCAHYILILTLKGSLTRHINQYTFDVGAHTLQLVPPNHIHSFNNTKENSDFYVILFNESFLDNIDKELLSFHKKNIDFVNLCEYNFKKIVNLYSEINIEYKQKKEYHIDVSKNILIQILYLLRREKVSNPITYIYNRQEQISNKFLSLIEENFSTLKKVSQYAKLLDISSKYLSQTVKQTLNESALFFIHKRIIKEIEYLLVYTNLSMKEISAVLNFSNPSDLGRLFKKYKNQTPKEYKNISYK